MVEDEEVDELRKRLIDRFTPEELLEIIIDTSPYVIGTGTIFDKFFEDCLEIDWEEYL